MAGALRTASEPTLDAVAAGRPPRARLLVGGEWAPPEAGGEFEVTSPWTGAAVGFAAAADRSDAVRAVAAASRASHDWATAPAVDRAELLVRAADLIEDRAEDAAKLIALEGGKPLTEARAEPAYAAGFLRFSAQAADRALAPRELPSPDGKRAVVRGRPVGVSGLVTIWNFPAAGVTRPLAAALAAGCTAVLKPAEQTPLTAAAVCELMDAAGLPPGVVNLITAEDPEPIGRELIENEDVRKLSFTGSAEVGGRLGGDAAARIKRITLELGGHAPLLVFADADLEGAVDGAMRSKFRNSGQTCVCPNRAYVERQVYEDFTERLADRVRGLRLGDPVDEATEVGPLIDAAALARVEAHVSDALTRGARLVCGGRRADGPGGRGLLYEPTLLADVPPGARMMREETFGPVLPLVSFEREQEALRAANALPWGLAAYLYTADADRQERLVQNLEYGVVGVNDPVPSAPGLPFGGVKLSGVGKEGGHAGIEEFLDLQLISTAVPGAI